MPSSLVTGALVVVGVLAVASVLGIVRARRDGRVRRAASPATDQAGTAALAALGVPGRAPVTLVQFSTVVCAPCVAARRVCVELAGSHDGVAHLEVDAEAHLDAVRALEVWRAPTVLVVDAAGVVRHRVSGVPRAEELRAAIDELLATAGIPR